LQADRKTFSRPFRAKNWLFWLPIARQFLATPDSPDPPHYFSRRDLPDRRRQKSACAFRYLLSPSRPGGQKALLARPLCLATHPV